jgi:hypothetical protein
MFYFITKQTLIQLHMATSCLTTSSGGVETPLANRFFMSTSKPDTFGGGDYKYLGGGRKVSAFCTTRGQKQKLIPLLYSVVFVHPIVVYLVKEFPHFVN